MTNQSLQSRTLTKLAEMEPMIGSMHQLAKDAASMAEIADQPLGEFRDILKAHRKRLKLTQVEAALLIGLSARTYSDWETGKFTPSKLCQAGAIGILTNS